MTCELGDLLLHSPKSKTTKSKTNFSTEIEVPDAARKQNKTNQNQKDGQIYTNFF